MNEKVKLIIRRFLYCYFMWFFVQVIGQIIISHVTPTELGEKLYTAEPYIFSAIAAVGFVILMHLKDKGKAI